MAVGNASGGASATAAPEDAAVGRALASDFQPLDSVAAGLAERAADYVLTGKDEAALTEIANAQRQTGGYGPSMGLLQKPGSFVHREHKLFLKDHGPHHVARLHRFGASRCAAGLAGHLQINRAERPAMAGAPSA